MYKWILAFCLQFAVCMPVLKSQIQEKAYTSQFQYTTEEGNWVFTPYNENIIKLTFLPKYYRLSEYISDAVILSPKNVSVKKINEKEWSWANRKIKITSDSILIGNVNLKHYYKRDSIRGFVFALKNKERLYGAGSRAISLNRRGHLLNLYNAPNYSYGENTENLNYSIPYLSSSNGYALLFDNPSKGFLDIGKTSSDELVYGATSGQLNCYIIFGETQQDILRRYHQLTGTQPLPPKWVLGNLMSRFGYTSQQQAEEIVSKMAGYNIPLDAIIFDLFWFGDSIKGTLGNFDWINKRKWPDPKKMIQSFKQKGIQTVLISEPYFVQTSRNYQASKKYLAVDSNNKPFLLTDFYFGRGGLLDIFRKDTKDWFWQFYNKQIKLGVEGWWGDLGEPETHPPAMHHNLKDYGFKRLFKAGEVHNLYGHLWTKMIYEKFAKHYPSKRLFSLNRSGFAGTQRYSIFPWSGDVSRSWEGLRAQLPIMLGMTMSGIPYAHADAGGFAGGNGDTELYTRWLQFACFTPILRPHGTALYDMDTTAFSFPSEPALIKNANARGIVSKAIDVRYRLTPYNYTLAYNHTTYGTPLVSPLYYYFEDDSIAAKVEDQFMWGENILVAPVLHKGATERKVYLPKGNWYKWYGNNELLQGAQWRNEKTTLEEIPLYIREGSLIPEAEPNLTKNYLSRTIGDYSNNDISWHYYPSKKPSTFILFDDDGKTKNSIQNGGYELITVRARPLKKGYVLNINFNSRSRQPSKRIFRFFIHDSSLSGLTVWVNGRKLKKSEVSYSNDFLFIKDIVFGGEPKLIEIK